MEQLELNIKSLVVTQLSDSVTFLDASYASLVCVCSEIDRARQRPEEGLDPGGWELITEDAFLHCEKATGHDNKIRKLWVSLCQGLLDAHQQWHYYSVHLF